MSHQGDTCYVYLGDFQGSDKQHWFRFQDRLVVWSLGPLALPTHIPYQRHRGLDPGMALGRPQVPCQAQWTWQTTTQLWDSSVGGQLRPLIRQSRTATLATDFATI